MPNIPISSLPLTTTVCSSALVPIVQNGVTCSTYACLLGSGGGGGGNITCIQAGCNVTVSPSCGIGVVTVSSIGGCFGISCIQAGCNVTVSPSCGVGVVTISSTGGGIGGNVTCLVAGDNVVISPSCGIGVVTVSTTGGGCCSCISYVNSITAGNGIVINPSSGCGDVTICSTATDTPMQRGNGILSIVGNTSLNCGCAAYSFIGNGDNNCTSICGSYSVIGGGTCNMICSGFSAILGGACNNFSGNAFVGAFGCGLINCNTCNNCTFYVNNLCVCGSTSMSNLIINPNCQICVGNNGQLVGFTGIGTAGVLCCSGINSTIRINASNTATGCNSFVVGTCNTSSGNYSSILGGSINNDCGLNDVVIIGLKNFNAPCECTTYVNCLSVRNISQGNRITVSANKTLIGAPPLFIYEDTFSLCSVGRPSTNAAACNGCFSASFISGCVFGSFSTSFSDNVNGFCSIPLVNGDYTYVGGIINISQGNNNYIGGGASICNNGICGNTILSGVGSVICTNSCYSTLGNGSYSNINGSFNTLLRGGNSDCIMFGASYNFVGGTSNSNVQASRSVSLNGQNNNLQPRLFITSANGCSKYLAADYAVSINGCCGFHGGNGCYSYSASAYSARVCAPFTSTLNTSGTDSNNPFGFIANAQPATNSGYFSAGIILRNGSFVQSSFSLFGNGSCSFAAGVCYNTMWSGNGNSTNATSSEVTHGINNNASANYSTIGNGNSNCTQGSASFIHGQLSGTGGPYSFVVGNNNCVPSLSCFSGIFGCCISNQISCSFMSNHLVACNIFGAASLCANASGIISPVVSDIRIKCNIQPLHYGIEELKKLNPVSYNWSDLYKESKGLSRKLGFIAQEVEKIVPEAVLNNQEFYIFDDKALIPIITKSIQNISKRIQILNKDLDIALEKV